VCYYTTVARRVKPRPYDTTNRQRQAAETRRRIFEAAQELFTRDGYVTTTIAAIADHAGVAVQTVYASTKSKREILKGIIDLAISGEEEQVPLQASSQWREIEAEPDPRTKLRELARLHRDICVREAPAFAIMADAAGSDPEIRTLMHDMADQRYQDHHRLAKTLHQTSHIRPDLSSRRAADIIWALANEQTYLALVRDRRWSTQDYEDWLADQLIAALLP
jgi:TetR/AcrR family transcriptional regulator, regulator of autoinduction and epiphytic fitness